MLVEFHPFVQKTYRDLSSSGRTSCPGIFLGYGFFCGWNLETRYIGRRHEELQVLRRSTSTRDKSERGEVHEGLLGESDGSPPSTRQDSPHDDGEAWNDFWSIARNYIYRHHVEPRVKFTFRGKRNSRFH